MSIFLFRLTGRRGTAAGTDRSRSQRQSLLNPACQFVLPFRADKRVLTGHVEAAVTGNPRSFDRAAAHLLAPGNVCTPEGVRSEAWKVAGLRLCGQMQRVPHPRVPERFRRRALLPEHERFRCSPFEHRLASKLCDQIAQSQHTAARFAFRWGDLLMPDPLLNPDRSLFEVNVLPVQPEHLRNSRTGRNAGLDDEAVRLAERASTRAVSSKERMPRSRLCRFLPSLAFAAGFTRPSGHSPWPSAWR